MYWVGGTLGLALAAASLSNLLFLTPDPVTSNVLILLGLVTIIMGILYIFVGFGLYALKAYGWQAAVVIGFLNIFYAPAAIVATIIVIMGGIQKPDFLVSPLLGLLVWELIYGLTFGLFSFKYLTSEGMKEFMRRALQEASFLENMGLYLSPSPFTPFGLPQTQPALPGAYGPITQPTYVSPGRSALVSGYVNSPKYMKAGESYSVTVRLIELKRKGFFDNIMEMMDLGSESLASAPIEIKPKAEGFEVSPKEHSVPVPLREVSHERSFRFISPKERGGPQMIIFEFYQAGSYLGSVEVDVEVGTADKESNVVRVPILPLTIAV